MILDLRFQNCPAKKSHWNRISRIHERSMKAPYRLVDGTATETRFCTKRLDQLILAILRVKRARMTTSIYFEFRRSSKSMGAKPGFHNFLGSSKSLILSTTAKFHKSEKSLGNIPVILPLFLEELEKITA